MQFLLTAGANESLLEHPALRPLSRSPRLLAALLLSLPVGASGGTSLSQTETSQGLIRLAKRMGAPQSLRKKLPKLLKRFPKAGSLHDLDLDATNAAEVLNQTFEQLRARLALYNELATLWSQLQAQANPDAATQAAIQRRFGRNARIVATSTPLQRNPAAIAVRSESSIIPAATGLRVGQAGTSEQRPRGTGKLAVVSLADHGDPLESAQAIADWIAQERSWITLQLQSEESTRGAFVGVTAQLRGFLDEAEAWLARAKRATASGARDALATAAGESQAVHDRGAQLRDEGIPPEVHFTRGTQSRVAIPDEVDDVWLPDPGDEMHSLKLALEHTLAHQRQQVERQLLHIGAWQRHLRTLLDEQADALLLAGLDPDSDNLGLSEAKRRQSLERPQSNGDSNTGVYHHQRAPLPFAERIAAAIVDEIAKQNADAAAAIRRRAKTIGKDAKPASDWTLASVLNHTATGVAALRIADAEAHRPNATPLYVIKEEMFSPEHEALIVRAVALVTQLARGLPGEATLRWHVRVRHEDRLAGDERYYGKRIVVQDGEQPLLSDARADPAPWQQYWTKSPVGERSRRILDAARYAVLEHLVARGLAVPDRPAEASVPVMDVLGLQGSDDPGNGPAATELYSAEVERFVQSVQAALADYQEQPPAFLATHRQQLQRASIAYDADRGRISLSWAEKQGSE